MNVIEPAGPAQPMTKQDRIWAEAAEKRETEALATIRGLAEKWATSLSAILGLVGLAALIDKSEAFAALDSPWKEIATISFVVAIVLALVATGLAVAAAQGSAKRYFLSSGSSLRQYSREAVDAALSLLKWSRIVAALAAACVLVAGGCLWFGDRAASTPTVIELPAGTQLCQGAQSPAEDSEAAFQIRCGGD